MKVSLFIAWKYFKVRGNKTLVHRIGFVAFLSVAITTAALLLALFAFNGLEGLTRSMLQSFDPDIKIDISVGKRFVYDPILVQKLYSIDGVEGVVQVIEDNAMLEYNNKQRVVRVKGVSEEFIASNRLQPFMVRGEIKMQSWNKNFFAIIGSNIQFNLGIPLGMHFPLQLIYPKSVITNALNMREAYRKYSIAVGGIFAVENHLDDIYVIVPLHFASKLMNAENTRTALEVYIRKGSSTLQVQNCIKASLPPGFRVNNSSQLQSSLMHAIAIERLFVFLIFSLILFIASINVFFVLAMLVINKRGDMWLLHALGMHSKIIRNIFLIEGFFISLGGAALGIGIAVIVALLQQNFEIITINTGNGVIAYPIQMKFPDFAYTTLWVFIATMISSILPARMASKESTEIK